ncbi:MAG TPA: cytochrome c-type biogenesis protein CcmH [Solirubrobacteraceae bacterium]|jgi:cytochrome c-type biogenesis protein CcmH|nr:cytochrome c-type biogenesis protein CcmH [Solirubrobacteraceae bacterium]
MRARAVVAALVAVALTATAAPAGAATPKTTLHAIEVQVMCVTCQIPLEVAESPAADQERQFIQTLINDGKTRKQILDALVADFGPGVLALPPDKGFNVLFYILPIAFVLAGLAIVSILLPRWKRNRRSPPPAGPAATAVTQADAERLDEDLKRYDP